LSAPLLPVTEIELHVGYILIYIFFGLLLLLFPPGGETHAGRPHACRRLGFGACNILPLVRPPSATGLGRFLFPVGPSQIFTGCRCSTVVGGAACNRYSRPLHTFRESGVSLCTTLFLGERRKRFGKGMNKKRATLLLLRQETFRG
ncbi:unnamed protein product, partial [Ectocarpus sp. 8 AP-2014]